MGLSPRVVAQEVLLQQDVSLRRFLDRCSEVAAEPDEGTHAAVDLVTLDRADMPPGASTWLRTHAERRVTAYLDAAGRHLKLIQTHFDPGGPEHLDSLPCMTLSRTILEVVLQACRLVDARAESDTRVARWAASQLYASQETVAMLEQFPPAPDLPDELPRFVKYREEDKRLLAKAGFRLTPKKGERLHDTAKVEWGSACVSVKEGTDQQVARYFPEVAYLWKLTSGATHGLDYADTFHEDDADVANTVVTTLLSVSDALVIELGGYLGMPVRDVLVETHHRRARLLQQSSASVEGLDSWRAFQSLPPLMGDRSPHDRRALTT